MRLFGLFRLKARSLLTMACVFVGGAAFAHAVGQSQFETEMSAAMERMDHSMGMSYSGDPDRDFANMMIPHHQGAVDMAELELRFGHNERLKRLAQGIIVEQQQEIAVMHQVVAELPVAEGQPMDQGK